jgi:hypothetical protein
MSVERRRVLDMLAQGKISAAEAERLIEKLVDSPEGSGAGRARLRGSVRAQLKYLRVVIERRDGRPVNIRIPLSLIRAGLRLGAMLPADANEKLVERGIDLSALSHLDGDELLRALEETSIDVDSSDGEHVRIFCE